MTRTYCDKCGKEITGDKHVVRVTDTHDEFNSTELCGDCYAEFLEAIKTFKIELFF